MDRNDGRALDGKRPLKLIADFTKYAEGSVLVELGDTRVLCNASVEEKVPPHLRDKAQGWVTAEYSMLPRATHDRSPREAAKGKQGGRTYEIQRLIGRSLRAITDMRRLGERTITVDCDVLQADGGTRTASITGGFVAMALAVKRLRAAGSVGGGVLTDYMAATSVGIVGGVAMLDLCYEEDSRAEVDMNVIMTGGGRFVELQGTAEKGSFDDEALAAMLALGRKGVMELVAAQRELLGELRKAAGFRATGRPARSRRPLHAAA